jgi:acetyltransferase-like isoleucine patch superfamily enzyme
MKLLRRGLSRLILHIIRFALVPVELLNSRLFMRMYLAVLRSYGLRTTGTPRYIASKVRFDDIDLVTLGDRTVISKYVILLTHDYSITTALRAIGARPETDISVRRAIVVGDNVFIGIGSILLPGTTIGDNVIIGAGSVVRGAVPSDSIVTGNPAQVTGSITSRADHWRKIGNGDSALRDAS